MVLSTIALKNTICNKSQITINMFADRWKFVIFPNFYEQFTKKAVMSQRVVQVKQ